jgi:threonine synthase
MHYYSTNNKKLHVDFKEATIKGQPLDKGLFFPAQIPQLKKDFINNIELLSKEDIAFEVIKPYVGNTIPDVDLKKIVSQTINFDFPLVGVTDSISSLELFHGPTLAFKDVGARFMSRCLSYFFKDANQKITVLVATSGDTGGAVAAAFYEVENVEVVILYPSGKVSSIQELQLTTLGKNIRAVEVDGSFDDCQRMVKQSFADKELNEQLFLTSANSINVARWLPQQFYYFFAWQQWHDKKVLPVIAVPSGNFGNICAGLLACHSGLPVQHFIAACNANDAVPDFFETEIYRAKQTVSTLSNAMDVGDPSNFIRVLELFNHDVESLKKMVTPYSIGDDETKQTIEELDIHIQDLFCQRVFQVFLNGPVQRTGTKLLVVTFIGQEAFCIFCQFKAEAQVVQPLQYTFIRISMISKMFSFDSELKMITSSIRFRNSGEKVRFRAFSITALLASSWFCVRAAWQNQHLHQNLSTDEHQC